MTKSFMFGIAVLSCLICFTASDHGYAMSLDDKAGQVLAVSFPGTFLSSDVRERLTMLKPGGLILYGKNVISPAQVRSLISEIRAEVPSDVPMMFAVDQEGGVVTRIRDDGAYFPGNMALGAAGDPDLAERQGTLMGIQLRSLGFDLDYAPVMDVNSNPYNPIIGARSFGDDPSIVSSMGCAMLKGFAESGIGCSAKHFPGHGDVDVDSHLGLPVLDRNLESLRKCELIPFQSAVTAGVPAVMTAHIVVPELTGTLPATLSPEAMSLLRKDLGFDGVILSDSMGMKAISDCWGVSEAAVMALRAGVDMILLGADPSFPSLRQIEVKNRIVEAVESGELDPARLDDAVDRIKRWKEQMGLFEKNDRPEWVDGSDLADEIASKSVTLVKVDGGPPLGEKGRPFTLVWPEKRKMSAEFLLGKLEDLGLSGTLVLFDEVPGPDIAAENLNGLVLLGGYDIFRDEVSSKLFREIMNKCSDTVLLSMRAPYDLLALPEVGTMLACYGDSPSTLKALASVLTGRFEPLGRLPVELPGFYPAGWRNSWSSKSR